jgi:hypothetical protein
MVLLSCSFVICQQEVRNYGVPHPGAEFETEPSGMRSRSGDRYTVTFGNIERRVEVQAGESE